MVAQIYWAGGFCLYAGALLFLTNLSYKLMINKGLEQGVSVYYNRKILHIFVGGAIAIAVPFIFIDPIYPLCMALALAVVTLVANTEATVTRILAITTAIAFIFPPCKNTF